MNHTNGKDFICPVKFDVGMKAGLYKGPFIYARILNGKFFKIRITMVSGYHQTKIDIIHSLRSYTKTEKIYVCRNWFDKLAKSETHKDL